MKKIITCIKKYFWYLVILIVVIGGIFMFVNRDRSDSSATTAFAVVEQISVGNVSSGIETTGEIVAAQKLDLDVYTQTKRIETVNIVNGGQVEAGDVLLSFDKSEAYVDAESAQVRVVEAELQLSEERTNYSDPNTQIRSLEQDIVELETAILQAEDDKVRAYRDYLNADLSAEPGNINTEDKTSPTISGLYSGVDAGEYKIYIYRSGADSGYSYRISGLSGLTDSVIFNIPTSLGEDGLEVTFNTTNNIQNGDEWIVAVPNVYAPEYIENREDYEETIVDLNEAIAGYQLDIANKQEEIANLRLTDSTSYRDLDIAKAEADLSEARVALSQSYDVVQEQDIVAPFSGTIEGMENVVVGATPTRDNDDPISLGTLISNEFLATFSLSAVDVAKVAVGQKVFVTVTSFPDTEPLTASIVEISSLPDSSGVAQYEVQALIEVASSTEIDLREGLLADIEVVQEEVTDVIRVPRSAITYESGRPQVQVVDTLSEEQQMQVDRIGILRSVDGTLPVYPVDITLGISGTFYAEVTDGLSEGDLIIVSEEASETPAVQQFGPGGSGGGPGGGGARPGGSGGASAGGASFSR